MGKIFDEKLNNYVELLLSWVGKIRLTGTQTREGLREHVDDALAALPYLPQGAKIIDVGTGGGLPGIVFAICRPDIRIVLLDSIRKKCAAVEGMCAALGLKNTSVVCARAEEYARTPGVAGSFDVAVARAVAATPALVGWLAPFVKKDGLALAFKGPKFSDEIAGCDKNYWRKFKLDEPEIIRYGERENALVIWRKAAK